MSVSAINDARHINNVAGHIKRKRRTKAQVEQLERQIYEVLETDHPQSVRHVFYRMTDPRLPEPVEKSERGYTHVQTRMTKMRRAGRLPYGWITDATRYGHFVDTFRDSAEFLRTMNHLYRGDLWRDADHYVEVWCESRSIAGVIRDTCKELAVSLYPSGGFTSLSFAHEAAQFIKDETRGRPAEILYIGDYDPAGVMIDKSIESELRLHVGGGVELNFHRLAINEEQIAEYDLPTKPRKKSDRRVAHIKATVEAEAMPAYTLRGLLRDAVEQYLPQGALHAAKVAESHERALMQSLAGRLDEGRL